ncbi:MAG: PhnD/SsuA/transferrin family substrate-binding protein [Ignavibacteriales bacterium]|nr:PhnD/SsuA/transferrin family substrate-binding protein [Ignavibacteriota bacterium]MCB9248377.1 PhnD/SsuA/transferrin family substrate-binding protein [Ignavibacteriales bacterium]
MKRIIIVCIILFNTILYSQDSFKKNYNFGISKEMLEDVNIRDAKATLELWTKVFTQSFEEVESIKITIYKNVNELINSANNNEVDLVYTSSLIYAMEMDKLNLEPKITSSVNNNKYFDILLCSSSDSKVSNFNELRNKSILIQGGKFKLINELWLDLLCLQIGEKDKNKFFKKIEFTEKPMQAVLPVFFKKTDCCIVNSASLESIAELNPQISKSLKVLFKREKLTSDIVCLRPSLTKKEKDLMMDRAINYKSLHKSEQLFKIFKTNGASVFEASDLDGVKSLWEDYKKLKSRLN